MNPIAFDSENYIDQLRAELALRRQRKIERRWTIGVTIAAAVIAAVFFLVARGIL